MLLQISQRTAGLKTASYLQHKLSPNRSIFHDIYACCYLYFVSFASPNSPTFFAPIFGEIHHKFVVLLVLQKKYKTKPEEQTLYCPTNQFEVNNTTLLKINHQKALHFIFKQHISTQQNVTSQSQVVFHLQLSCYVRS
jgi:hypothetical protein